MMTDPIADMLTRIRNAGRAGRTELEMPYSRVKFEIAKILEREGYLARVVGDSERRTLTVRLPTPVGGRAAIKGLERLSTPGRRVYVGWREIPRVVSGLGITIVSTSQGIMTGGEARARRLGGELVCAVH